MQIKTNLVIKIEFFNHFFKSQLQEKLEKKMQKEKYLFNHYMIFSESSHIY